MIKAYNGKIIFVDNLIQGYKLSRKLNKQIKNSFLLSQFESVDNIDAHYNTTAQEIINDLNNIDTFISPYGTAGSIIGISKKLKEYSNKIKTVCVTLDNKIHHVEGVYSMLKTPLLDKRLIDNIIKVNDVDVYKTQKEIVKKEGLFLGLSSALSLLGAIKYIKNNNVKNVVVLCPDGGERYLSNKYIFDEKYSKNEVINDIEYIYDNLLSHKDFVNDEIFFKYGISINQIINIRKLLYLDAKAIYNNDPACDSVHQVIKVYNSFFAILSYRIANIIYKNKSKEIARIISEYAKSKTSIDIHPQAKIGKSFAIDHGVGVVIGQTSVIKDNVTLYHGVTLGAKSLNGKRKLRNIKRHPTILNNVTIYANATILGGNTTIGNNCIIGTNKIVTDSLKDNTILK